MQSCQNCVTGQHMSSSYPPPPPHTHTHTLTVSLQKQPSCWELLPGRPCIWFQGRACYIFMWANISNRNSHVGRHVLFSNDHPVTLVLHGLLPLHSLYNIHVLLHNIWHPLSFEQIPLIQIYQINHTLIKTINLQLFLSPWKTLRLFTMSHSHNNNYSVCFLHLLTILLA